MSVITRHNLCTNPSLEVSTAGWVANGVHPPTLAQSTTHWPGAGSQGMQVTLATGVSGDFNGAKMTITTVIGTTYTVSAWLFVPTGTSPVSLLVSGITFGANTTLFDQWQRINVVFTATATTSTIGTWVVGPSTAGQLFYMDAVLVEPTDMLLPYFDGDSVGAGWDGTVELSASTFVSFNTDPSLPETVIEFDALPQQATDFVLDSSLLDGTMVLVDNPRYVNIALAGDIVTQVSIQRGRTDPNGDIQPGTATVYCDNWSGNLDPENMASPYNSDPNRSLKKGMLCRISALFSSGGVYEAETLYVGRLDNLTLREGLQPDATLTFVDDMAIMGTTDMPMFDNSIRSNETSISRATWLYYSIGQLNTYTELNLSAAFSGTLSRGLVPTYGGGSVLDELVDVTAAEAGRCFVSRTGIFTILSHSDLLVQTSIGTLSDGVASLGIEYADVETSSGTAQVINACRAHVYSQPSPYFPDKFGIDPVSVGKYGQNQYNGSVGYKAPLFDQGDLAAIAQYIATRFAEPVTRFDSVTVDYTGNGNAAPLLAAEIGGQVTISRTMPYLSGQSPYTITSIIEGVQFTITPTSFLQKLVTSLTDSASLFGGATIFELDSSLLDGPDVLSAF